MCPLIESMGAIVLNRSIGSLNPHAARAAIHNGARVVSMPSNHAKHHAEFFWSRTTRSSAAGAKHLLGEGVAILEEDGVRLSAAVSTIRELLAENDVALALGTPPCQRSAPFGQRSAPFGRGETLNPDDSRISAAG